MSGIDIVKIGKQGMLYLTELAGRKKAVAMHKNCLINNAKCQSGIKSNVRFLIVVLLKVKNKNLWITFFKMTQDEFILHKII